MVIGIKNVCLVLTVAILSMMSGCQKKGGTATCKNDADCRVDATGKEVAGICYMGKCEECAEDTDCSDLKQCVSNRCVSACQADADCGSNERCQNSYCVASSTGDNKNAWAQGECREIEKVYFDFDRYEIKAEYKDQVSKLAKCLENNPGYMVSIEGHTDDRGTPSYNMVLGQKRADSVKNHLKTAWGIATERVKTLSYGEQKPAVNESTEYAWQQNRRAEFTLEQN
jgi:peptidoglycan-associated lipoprotein